MIMRYTRLAFQYLRKNWWYLLAVVLVPSVIMGVFTEPCTMIRLFANFRLDELNTFSDVFFGVSELNWLSFLIGIFALPILAVFFSVVCGMESKHMRWGILSARDIGKKINNNFLPVIKLLFIFVLAMELYAVICALFTFLWVKVTGRFYVALGLTIVTNVVLFLVLLSAMVLLSLVLPIMSITGFNLRKSIAESTSLMKGKFFKMLFAIVIPMLIPYVIMATMGVYDFWWRKIINTFIYAFVFSYYITLMYTTYMDIADIDREDLKNKYLKMVED